MTRLRIGIDFGGTKIEAVALNRAGDLLLRERVPNPGGYTLAIEAIQGLVQGIEQELGATGTVGIGVPGSLSPRTGLMRNANSLWLNGKAFKHDLEAALGREIRLANDANCLVLSEALDGAAAGRRSVFGVIIGTGVGGGLVIDGKLVEGSARIAGEFGHTPLPWPRNSEFPGETCWCGRSNCLEAWVSGTGFQRAYARSVGRDVIPAAKIIEGARAGDIKQREAFDDYVDRLARGLAVVANIVDPDCFVLGGGMSNVTELYGALPDRVRHYAFSDVWDGEIVQARWGDSSGVRGAAMLWPVGRSVGADPSQLVPTLD
ncbi:MAG: ROK family protein [Sphingobium sp.]|nr:ROK family protein [Sphingobium sp.]